MNEHEVIVNGAGRRIDADVTVESLVAEMVPGATEGRDATGTARRPRGVAVAVNDTVVPRGAWSSTLLSSGDRVEILTAVQGG